MLPEDRDGSLSFDRFSAFIYNRRFGEKVTNCVKTEGTVCYQVEIIVCPNSHRSIPREGQESGYSSFSLNCKNVPMGNAADSERHFTPSAFTIMASAR